MLETYFAKPETVERIRASWIGSEIEQYVGWMADHGYDVRSIWRRVPRAVAFLESSRASGERRTSLTCLRMSTRTWPSKFVAIAAIGRTALQRSRWPKKFADRSSRC